MRLLLFLVGGALLIMLIKRMLSNKSTGQNSTPPQDTGVNPGSGSIDMVQCRHCQVHLAVTDAIQSKEGFFCSTEHLDRHRKRDGQ